DSNIERVLDLGFVGEPDAVHPEVLLPFVNTEFIPVIAPIGIGPDGMTYNINADTAAGAVAAALGAARFFLLTDVPGVMDRDRTLIPEITPERAAELVADGTISGGMIP